MEGLGNGTVFALPPVLNYGAPTLKTKIVDEVLTGKKHMALAITEAFAGSDVAGMKCRATKSDDGKYWTVTGTKKWITNGMFADYFTVACKTDKGFVVLLIERQDGVDTKPIKTAYSATAGTAFVIFDHVKVPYEHTLGTDHGGLQVVFSNFNHERWYEASISVAAQRLVVEECIKWATQRQVFGKPLMHQATVRQKISQMIARVESAQNWLENITYQMCKMGYKQQSSYLAGQIALFKMYCTKTAQSTSEDATQVFGGRAVTCTGMGKLIERYRRAVSFDALLGGTEDVLGDLGVRQALRKMPIQVKL